MPYDPKKHHRRSIRLKGYDYTQPGAYFITICTQNRECLFGEVVDGRMVLNELGQVARECWLAIPDHFPHSRLDEFVIMPNHVHGIIWIVGPDGKKELPAVGWNRIPVGAKDLLPPGQPFPKAKRDIPNHWFDGQRIQDRGDQMGTAAHRYLSGLATQLLRTHHSQHGGVASHSMVHSDEPAAVGRRPPVETLHRNVSTGGLHRNVSTDGLHRKILSFLVYRFRATQGFPGVFLLLLRSGFVGAFPWFF